MTRDDIIRMAREAHLDVYGLGKDHEKFMSVVERFAALVAAVEREACWQIAHDTYEGFGSNAKGVDYVKHHIMKQIRARGQE